jgi:transcriptional regulator with XRE-family HTH domain
VAKTKRIPVPGITGTMIAALRDQAGLTQAQLAAASGYSRQYLAHIEQGRYAIHVRFFQAVMAALAVMARTGKSPDAP